MQISTIRNILLASVAVGALAACETTTADNGPVDNGPVDNGPVNGGDVTTGTTSGEESSNGLPFAIGKGKNDIELGDLIAHGDYDVLPHEDGELTLTLRAAKLTTVDTDGDSVTSTSVELEDLTISSIAYAYGDTILSLDLGGETALVNLSDLGDPFVSSEGYSYWVIPFPATNNTIVIYAHGDLEDGDDEYYRDVFAIAGFETNPDLLASKGLATYSGYWGGLFSSVEDNVLSEFEWGDIDINADFGAATIDGELGDDDGIIAAEFEGEIAGNGWYAVTDGGTFDGDDILEGGAQLDGVFYGVTGEETAGTIMFDADVDDDNGSYDVTGAGLFVACEDEVECGLDD